MGFLKNLKDFALGDDMKNNQKSSSASSTSSRTTTRQTSAPRQQQVKPQTRSGGRALDEILYFNHTRTYDYDYSSIIPREQIGLWKVIASDKFIHGEDANGNRGIGLSGYAGTQVVETKDDKNDIVAVSFYIQDNNVSKDKFGRVIDGRLYVLIDAADYDKLDVATFIKQTDADIKQCVAKGMSIYDICDRYPVSYNNDYHRMNNVINFYDGFKVEENGVVKTHIPPKEKNYDRAIRTKEGTLVTGSLKSLDKGM